MAPQILSDENGVTLVELVIAAGILTVAMVLLMGGLIEMNQTNAISENQAVASAQLESVVEEIQSLSYEDLLAYQPPAFDGLGADSAIVVEAFRSNGGTVMLPVGATFSETLPNPAPVRVRIVWVDLQGRAYASAVSTFHRRL